MPRALFALLPMLMVAACGPDDGETVAGPDAESPLPDPSIAGEIDAAPALKEARYGVTAADCNADNRYMNEVVEISGDELVYQGVARPLARYGEDGTYFFRAEGDDADSEERVRIENDRLIRFSDDPALRTVYARCR
ncbi:hypothetical protein WJT74_01480 [Sphingomicrobium sp. XHP0239]|uniref:hypothetical protein n=1 Tax=Sphingomicrobium maritimum TaxID=3133972 RepID=UPI0031CCC3C2